ncbi:MAG: cobalt ECF transporter T component CbiQ [Sedimentibacter sp.]|uniref:cobalt ECF transporter T component CbiQ n=1 Tax=Sedimentibacter sp. TaxID=1960295 RepID=UPI0031582E21
MTKITKSMYELRYFDEAAQKDTVIHRLNSLVKLTVSIFYVLAVVSYGKYEIVSMLPMVIYPVLVFNLGDLEFLQVFKRLLPMLPVILLLGVSNPILDRETVTVIGNIVVSRGLLSFISLIIKGTLTVICGMLLIATTSVDDLAKALGRLHVPKIFIIIFLLTYRYTYVLIEEFSNINTSYSLRAPCQKGIHHRLWGPLLGQLLMRTYDRAQAVYSAMSLRGYRGEYHRGENFTELSDYAYLILWIAFFTMVRFNNVPVMLGNIMTGVFQ